MDDVIFLEKLKTMLLDLSTEMDDFIENLVKNKKKIVTKIRTPLFLRKHRGNGDYLSERKVIVPPSTTFTINEEEGESLFVVPSKSVYHNLIMLEGDVKKGDDEVITFQEYKMTPKHFKKYFRVIH